MGNSSKKPIIGIIGGIGSGKSTVATGFGELGCEVIDADKIAHELLNRVDIREKVAKSFGGNILDSNNRIIRKKLADIVFADGNKLAQLNKILHPPVLKKTTELIAQYNHRAGVKAIVLDMPLLAEVGWLDRCDRVVFVDCKENLRLERAKEEGIFNKNQLKFRENFQISLDKKIKLADNTIDNNSGLSALTKQIDVIFSSIMSKL
ncbi:MAG: dephospho-CoA kinase [Planctomycetota bacterium]